MKTLWRIAKEAKKYRGLLIAAALSTLVLTGLGLLAPRMLSNITGLVASGVTEESLKKVMYISAGLLLIYMFRILLRFLGNYLSHKAAWNLVHELRIKVYNTIQSFSMDYFSDKQTGELMSRIINDTGTFEFLYAHIMLDMVTNFVTLAGVTVILFIINARLALLTCIPVPFIVASGWFFSKKVRPNFQKMQKEQGEMSAQLQDNLSGVKEIQAFGRQKSALDNFNDKSMGFTKTMLRALKLSAIFHPSVEFLTSIGSVIVVSFGGYLAYKNQLSVTDIVSFLLYLSLFYAPIAGLSNILETASQSMAGAERVIEILDTPMSIRDLPDAQDIGNVKGDIKFNNVSFSYIEGVPILNNVSFEIKPGMMAAFVGATGVGKSTIIQLVSRFYDPNDGTIELDGHDLKSITLESLRKNSSIVMQDTFLFNGTVAENIAFSSPNATNEEIEASARIARVHEEILNMPDGYQTQVGERGVKLSGGQKQRMAIARAILCKAPVLILDEATASVDVGTEQQIQHAINEIAGTRTILIIAHRLSTIRNADVIFVFDKGCIVQQGNHKKLMEQDGIYKQMCTVQETEGGAAQLKIDN